MLYDTELEKKVLACGLHNASYLQKLPDAFFTDSRFSRLRHAILDFVAEYSVVPTSETFSTGPDTDSILLGALIEIEQTTADISQFPVYVRYLYDLHCKRVLYNEINRCTQAIETKSGSELTQGVIAKLVSLHNPLNIGEVTRGFHYERAAERWQEYLAIEANPDSQRGTSFGIKFFDKVTGGGLRPGWSVAFRGETKSGKSRLLFNISYNIARYQKRFVMHVTREMTRKWLEWCIDSRDSRLEFTDIVQGKLGGDKDLYGEVLKRQLVRLDPLYIVDIPTTCTVRDIASELDLAYSQFGQYPDGVVIDYAGLMNPDQAFQSQYERYNFLSQELHELAHQYNIWIVTAYQSSITGEHTAFSSHIKDHVEVMFELVTDEARRQANTLLVRVESNRYGPGDEEEELFAPFALNYVGDWDVDISLLGENIGRSTEQGPRLLQRTTT